MPMSDADNDPPEYPKRPPSDCERFLEERRRYAEARSEARRLKRLGDEGDSEQTGEHPWLTASRIAKGDSEDPEDERSPVDAPGATSRMWFAGVAFLLCVSVAIYGALRVAGDHRAAPRPGKHTIVLHVWHSIEGPELTHLTQLAAAFLRRGRYRADQADIERAVRQSLFQESGPDVVILGMNEARSLAELGILEPVNANRRRRRIRGSLCAFGRPLALEPASGRRHPQTSRGSSRLRGTSRICSLSSRTSA